MSAVQRFERMQQLLADVFKELDALIQEVPEHAYELNSIRLKTAEVQRNIHHVSRRVQPPAEEGEPIRPQAGEPKNVQEMSRHLHVHLQKCKEYMDAMAEGDADFQAFHREARSLINRVQDLLQMYWEGRPYPEKKEEPIESKDLPPLPDFLTRSASEPGRDVDVPTFLRWRKKLT